MSIKTVKGSSSMSVDEILLNLQGEWKCIDYPFFLLHIKGDNISVNKERPQKMVLERFDRSWSFYIHVDIPNKDNPIWSTKIDRVIVETFSNSYARKREFAFSTIYPADAKSWKDMDYHDNTIFRFEQID